MQPILQYGFLLWHLLCILVVINRMIGLYRPPLPITVLVLLPSHKTYTTMRLLVYLCTAALLLPSIYGSAQDKLTLRASITEVGTTYAPDRVRGMQWVMDSDYYTYVSKDRKALMIATANKDDDKELVTAEALGKALGAEDELQKFLPYKWETPTQFRVHYKHQYFVYDTKLKKARKVMDTSKDGANMEYAPKGEAVAYTVGNNLFIDTPKGQVQVTNETEDGIVCGQAVHRYEFGVAKGTFWAEDGTKLGFYRKDETMVTEYPIVDHTTRPASLNSTRYPMAGMASHHVTFGIYDLASGKTVYLKTGEPKEHYLTNLTWDPSGKFIYMAELNRDQNHLRYNKYDVASGEKVATVFEEKHDKYIEPKHAASFIPGKANEFLWMSARDGYTHLYHYSTDGKLKKQLTSGNWVVKNLLGFRNNGSSCLIEHTNEGGLEQHVSLIDLKAGKMKQLTNGGKNKGAMSGFHRARYRGGAYFIDAYSSVDLPGRTQVLDLGGKKRKDIMESRNPMKDVQYRAPQLVTLDAEDGTKLNGRLILPHDFDKNKKYPVLLYVYNGPGIQMIYNRWLGRASLWMYHFANKGYVVFTVDGRGSSNRGSKFEQATFRQLGEVELKDQLKAVDYLKNLAYVDADRMAIHGWSYGGFMTTSMMLKYPDVFKVGVAGGPVMDWKYYEVMYTERYMDTPETNPEGYAKASLLDKAANLEGELLIIHGAVDDVVLPQHSMDFLKHCVDDGVQVDFFTYPGHPHNVRGVDRVHLYKKVLDYIEDAL